MNLLKIRKVKSEDGKIEYKNKYFTFYPKFENFKITYSPYSYFDPRPEIVICLGWGQLFIHLPFWLKKDKSDECDWPQYGVYYFMNQMWFWWGCKKKVIDMPWIYKWHRTSLLLKDETWIHEWNGSRIKDRYSKEFKEKLWSKRYYYKNTMKNGETEETTATVKVEEREWRMKWFPFIKRVVKSIDVKFDDELGFGKGSWKGGTVGVGYNMKRHETPLDTLLRMSEERRI